MADVRHVFLIPLEEADPGLVDRLLRHRIHHVFQRGLDEELIALLVGAGMTVAVILGRVEPDDLPPGPSAVIADTGTLEDARADLEDAGVPCL